MQILSEFFFLELLITSLHFELGMPNSYSTQRLASVSLQSKKKSIPALTKFFSRCNVYTFIKRVWKTKITSPRDKQIVGSLSQGSDRDVTALQFSRVSERITLDNVKPTLFEAQITYEKSVPSYKFREYFV